MIIQGISSKKGLYLHLIDKGKPTNSLAIDQFYQAPSLLIWLHKESLFLACF
jgi:hypothetical protein